MQDDLCIWCVAHEASNFYLNKTSKTHGMGPIGEHNDQTKRASQLRCDKVTKAIPISGAILPKTFWEWTSYC